MKKTPLYLALLMVLSLAIFAYKKKQSDRAFEKSYFKNLERKRWAGIGCGTFDLQEIDNNSIPLLTGWGNYSFKISTPSDSAQIYFNQGLSLYYAFHIIEAMGSFNRAENFDSTSAMVWWGKALALGPNINDFGYTASPEALEANKKALEFSGNCTAIEKALIGAMQVRYTPDTTATRVSLNLRYADAMKSLTGQFPDNAEAWTLYADALMVQHPWDLYQQNGEPKPWTPPIVAVLEQAIKLSPKHPGANHYFIHAIEGSNEPSKGLPSADLLATLMPAVSHIVHMPSHIYIRTGNYAEGETVNESALQGYSQYVNQYSPVANADFLYVVHNLHLQAACANMEGRSAYSDSIALACRQSINPNYLDEPGYFGTVSQYVWMTPFFTKIRFGKWADVLKEPKVKESHAYATVIWHFGSGVAFARTGQTTLAKLELELLKTAMKDSVLLIGASTFNPPIAGAGVAEKLLEGVIAEASNDTTAALSMLRKAVELEDAMMYGEPKDWPLPARHFLAEALLNFSKYADAIAVLEKDLTINPKNGWALYGQWQAYKKLQDFNKAKIAKLNLDKAFARYDMNRMATAF